MRKQSRIHTYAGQHRKHWGIRAALLTASLLLVPAFASAAWVKEPASGTIPTKYGGESAPRKAELRFLNPSVAPQQKLGTLIIGCKGDSSHGCSGEVAKLCLNSDPRFPANDPIACRDTWASTTGLYWNLNQLGGAANGAMLSNYSQNNGYVRLKSRSPQRYSLIIEANPATPSTALYVPTIIPSDDYRYAAKFSGATLVGSSDPTSDKELCLNGTSYPAPAIGVDPASRGCVRRWSDLFFGPSGAAYVNLVENNTAPPIQTGRAGVTKNINFGSLIAGDLNAISPPPLIQYTCGNGRCESHTTPPEPGNCAIDCSNISMAPRTFEAYPGNAKVFFDSRTPTSGGSWHGIVLQKIGSPTTVRPVDGIQYVTGQAIGDATVVYANSGIGNNSPFPGLSPKSNYLVSTVSHNYANGTKYYFTGFVANGYPRYGPGLSTSAQPGTRTAQLAIAVEPPGSGTFAVTVLFGEGSNMSTTTTGNGTYVPGTKVAFDAFPGPGRSFCGFSSLCSTPGTHCETVITQDASVAAGFALGGLGCANF